jgi:hypothetical protein
MDVLAAWGGIRPYRDLPFPGLIDEPVADLHAEPVALVGEYSIPVVYKAEEESRIRGLPGGAGRVGPARAIRSPGPPAAAATAEW